MKTKRTPATTVDSYIAGFPPSVRAKLRTMRATIRAAAPQAREKVSYGIPTLFLGRNLVHFAAFKSHVGFYPGAAAIAKFASQLDKYEVSKGTVRIPLDRPIPVALIQRIVRFRVRMEEERT